MPPVADPSTAPRPERIIFNTIRSRPRTGIESEPVQPTRSNIAQDAIVHATPGPRDKIVELVSNYVRLSPLDKAHINKYRVDFEPDVESVRMRRKLFEEAIRGKWKPPVMFDNAAEARAAFQTETDETTYKVDFEEVNYTVSVKKTGQITWGAFDQLQLYNLNMKNFLKKLGFFGVGKAGVMVHHELANPIGQELVMIRGFQTGANVHEDDQILMNLKPVHKLLQKRNVLNVLTEIRSRNRENFVQAAKVELTGKLVVSNYGKKLNYKIEDIDFTRNPNSTFHHKKTDKDVRFADYFRTVHNLEVKDLGQPLLICVENKKARDGEEPSECCMIPELCNIAGLTESQRNDNRMKTTLIQASQFPPAARVEHLRDFLGRLKNSSEVISELKRWNYDYDKDLVTIKARTLPNEAVAFKRDSSKNPSDWPKVDFSASFDRLLMSSSLVVAPTLDKLAILISQRDSQHQASILSRIRQGFDKIGLVPADVKVIMTRGDRATDYVEALRNLPEFVSAAIVLMFSQNKEKYDAIKKYASCERGLITQVVTCKLMTDDRKANSAAIKIGVQLAAKLGGEPWWVNLPQNLGAMICGYDTYHDTTQRGRSFGAFVASMNSRFSKWYSKADSHQKLEELSSHMSRNCLDAMQHYKQANGQYPGRVFIYRDGVSDGELDHVQKVELKEVIKVLKTIDQEIRVTYIIVNKAIGARFYLKQPGGTNFDNPPPGTIVDNVVTRKERYDFYLVSQSTHRGTVTPTYYNIINDESGLKVNLLQMLTFRMCFNYYNWTGTVRVPAPCQYAHKLALLCGEHLHIPPKNDLSNRLHFL